MRGWYRKSEDGEARIEKREWVSGNGCGRVDVEEWMCWNCC